MHRKISDYRLITGVIGEDVHVTGIRIMEHALRNEGFTVHSLGIHNTQDEFVAAAIEHKADALIISSLCGHAVLLMNGLRAKCIDAGIGKIHICIGGQLVINEEPWTVTEHKFKMLGVDRVNVPFILPKDAIALLIEDLKISAESFNTKTTT